MPTKQEMIDKIYEVIADKTLSFGCKIQINYNGEYIWEWWQECYSEKSEILYMWNNWETIEDDWNLCYDIIKNTNQDWWNEDAEIYINVIWHPVMIWDVLERRQLIQPIKYWREKDWQDICYHWWLKREPIQDQSEECITFIYNLVKDTKNQQLNI